MASIAGLNATANLAAYVAGKAGIIGLTKVAALDYADQGIRVNFVAPGPIRTHHLAAAGPEARRQAGLSTPMRRTGTAAEVASAVLWLCSELCCARSCGCARSNRRPAPRSANLGLRVVR